MASKRPPMSMPELEARGRHAILRSAEEVQAEEALLQQQPESQNSGKPESQHPRNTESPNAGNTARRTPRKPADQENRIPDDQQPGAENGQTRVKVTYRLSPEAFDAIYEAKQLLRRRRIKASLEEIAEEAIMAAYQDLLDNPGHSMLERKLPRKT
jgi:hypothetical protein